MTETGRRFVFWLTTGLTRIAERVRDRPKQSSELPDNPLGLPAVSAAPRAVLSEKLRGAGRARPPLTNAQ
jgi:hypothetical protein